MLVRINRYVTEFTEVDIDTDNVDEANSAALKLATTSRTLWRRDYGYSYQIAGLPHVYDEDGLSTVGHVLKTSGQRTK